MHYRTLGKTGLHVSEIGFGAWGIGGAGWVGAKDDESLHALNRAIDLGLNFIDTAYGYGDGHSEQLIGQVLRERSERVYVATKIPPKNGRFPTAHTTPVEDVFPGEYVREYTERSLRNLGVGALDVQQFHVWSDTWMDQGDWLDVVQQLKTEGKVRENYHGTPLGGRSCASFSDYSMRVCPHKPSDQSAERWVRL